MEIYKDTYEELIVYKYKDEEIFRVKRYDYMSEKIFQNKLEKFQQLYPKMTIEKIFPGKIGICEFCKRPVYNNNAGTFNDYKWMISDELWQKYSTGRFYHPLCFQALMMKLYKPSDFNAAPINYTTKSIAINLFKDQYINFLSQYLPESKKISSFKYSICSCGDICFVKHIVYPSFTSDFFGQYQLKDYNKKKCLPCLCIDYGRKPLIKDFTVNEVNIYSNNYITGLNRSFIDNYLNKFFNSKNYFMEGKDDPNNYCKKCKQFYLGATVKFGYINDKKISPICYLCACVENGKKIPYGEVESVIDKKNPYNKSELRKTYNSDYFKALVKKQEKYRFFIDYTKYLD